LSNIKVAILPILAAIGGMVFPALIFFSINAGTDSVNGWGVPMATDIAKMTYPPSPKAASIFDRYKRQRLPTQHLNHPQ
jgi:hypothetical protein